MDQNRLKSKLKDIAKTQWATNQKPILLSDVAPILAKEAGTVDYRTLLDGKSLKAFIKDTGKDNGYRLVEHPTQGAKVGLVPLESQFEFAPTGTENFPKKSDVFRKHGNRAVALLEILATLPEEDLAQISIPVSVFVKLLK